jgi:prevent-host-death family protein
MESISSSISTRELRSRLSDVIGRTTYGHERVGITRNGKLSAVVVGVDDFELFEQLEMARDVAAYREAKSQDDGTRISLAELRGEIGE